MVEYTKRRNKNRGYMSLRVWHRAIDLYKLVCRIVYVDNKIEFKLRAQIADAASSVSSNISEGYSRRSIHEYIQHVYVALGSLSETLSRAIAFLAADKFQNHNSRSWTHCTMKLKTISGSCWRAWKRNAISVHGLLAHQKISKIIIQLAQSNLIKPISHQLKNPLLSQSHQSKNPSIHQSNNPNSQ